MSDINTEIEEMADKIKAKVDFFDHKGRIEGEDLKVGGKGMISFYDRTVPNLIKKVARKLDKKAQLSEVDLGVKTTGKFTDQFIDAAQSFKDNNNTREEAVEGMISAYPDAPVINITGAVGEVYGQAVQSIPITDAMRTEAMAGQPLFQEGARGGWLRRLGACAGSCSGIGAQV